MNVNVVTHMALPSPSATGSLTTEARKAPEAPVGEAPAGQTAAGQTAASTATGSATGTGDHATPLHVIFDPRSRFDAGAQVFVTEFHDSETGEVKRQIPDPRQLRAYEEAARLRRDAASSSRGTPDAAAGPGSASERPASDRPASERPASERPASERPASDRAADLARGGRGTPPHATALMRTAQATATATGMGEAVDRKSSSVQHYV
jgi:hypothetical protein